MEIKYPYNCFVVFSIQSIIMADFLMSETIILTIFKFLVELKEYNLLNLVIYCFLAASLYSGD